MRSLGKLRQRLFIVVQIIQRSIWGWLHGKRLQMDAYSDVTVAKNYLNEKQIRSLECAVTGYFNYTENLIEREYIYNGRVCFKCK